MIKIILNHNLTIDIIWILNNIKKNKNSILHSTIYLLFFASLLLYIISLKGCSLSIKECSESKKVKIYFKLGYALIISSIIFGILICIQIISRFRCIMNIIFILIYLIIFFISKGTDFKNHGTYNAIIFILSFPFFSFISFIIYKTFYFCYHCKIKKLLIIILFFLFILTLFKIKTKCKTFFDGIGGIKLINDKLYNKCFIKIPKTCGQDYLSGVFDANFFRKNDCRGYNDEKKIFLKYLDKKLQIYDNFSYPRTEYWDPQKSYRNLANLVENEIKEANQNNSMNREVFIFFKDGKGKINISLKENKSLILEKRNIVRNNHLKFNNVYLIYLDAISRNHFIRKLKKSSEILEKILYTNKTKEKNFIKYNAFQFFKYHNFNGFTEGNIFPLFFGNKRDSNKGISILKFFNEKGFITASTHNSCNKEIFDWPENNKQVTFSHYDHENVAMFCDPNYEDKNDKWSIINGKSSIFRKCLYGRDSFEYNFEYIEQFLEIYKSENKFFRIVIGDGHEGTSEVIKYIDNSLSSFLLKILDNYFDDKTAVFVFSDHGAHMPGPSDILFSEERIFERYLGFLFLIIPNLTIYNSTNILFNQQQFITTYDIHDTLLDMIDIDKFLYKNLDWNKGQTLFLKINGKERNCEKYEGEIINNFCFCENYEK